MLEFIKNKIPSYKFLNFTFIILVFLFYLPTALLETQYADWRTITSHWFGIETTLKDYFQWPLHNPWIGGGQPNYGSAFSDTISLRTPFILLFGAERGYLISFIPLILFTYFGSRNLGNKIFNGPKYYSLIFAFLYATSASYVSHLIVGHGMIIQSTTFLPWIIYYFLKYKYDNLSAYKAGILYSLSLYESIAYGSQYIIVIIFLFFIIELLKKDKSTISLIRWGSIFLISSILISIFKFITVLDAIDGFERVVSYDYNYPIVTFLNSFINSSWITPSYIDSQLYCAGSWEISNYIGYSAVFLIMYSFLLKPGKFHLMAIIFTLSLIGNTHFFSLFYWLKYLPFFESHLCFGRVRILSSLFLIVLMVFGLKKLISDLDKLNLSYRLLLFIKISIFSLLFFPTSLTFVTMNEFYKSIDKIEQELPKYKNPHKFPLQFSIEDEKIKMFQDYSFSKLFENGFGIYDSNQYSNLGHPKKNMYNTLNSEDYKGEYYQSDKIVMPDFWSPNKITFSNLDPKKELYLNLVPSNAWIINGERVFDSYRIYEPEKIFSIMPDNKGVVEMIYKPKYYYFAIFAQLISIALLVLIYVVDRRVILQRL